MKLILTLKQDAKNRIYDNIYYWSLTNSGQSHIYFLVHC